MLKTSSFSSRLAFLCSTLLLVLAHSIQAQNLPAEFHYSPDGKTLSRGDLLAYTVTAPVSANGVVINEVLASNTTNATDEAGDHDDWVELFNNNDFEVNLSGYYVSDDIADPTKWQMPSGTLIPSHSYLIVWADDEAVEGPLHANWKIAAGGESIILRDAAQNIVDSVTFGQQVTDMGYARVPNGTGGFIIQAATYKSINTVQHMTNGVVINEVLAINVAGATDEAGDHEDWIELYNNNNFDVSLSGFHLSDDGGVLDKWTFPNGTTIAAHDYLIIWADNEAAEGPLHAAWKLNNGGESVIFSNALSQVLDQAAFGNQGADTAYARIPNGTGEFIQKPPTFNENNETVSSTSEITLQNIILYPNPGSTEVSIKIENTLLGKSYFITDLTGRILLTGVLFQNLNSLDIASLMPGQYFCVIKDKYPITLQLVKI